MDLETMESKADMLKIWASRIVERLSGAQDQLQAAKDCWDEVMSEGHGELSQDMPEGY
jgi:predicted trehalose synthase